MTAHITVPPEYDMNRIFELVNASGDMWYNNGELFVEGAGQSFLDAALTAYEAEHEHNLATREAIDAMRKVDEAAGLKRLQYITDSPGQAIVYVFKYIHAKAYQDAGYTGTVPALVQSEANAFSLTAQAAAESILSQTDGLIAIAAAVDEARRTAKAAIDTALETDDVTEIIATKNSIITTISEIQ